MPPGTIGPYEIVSPLGAGGMGEVYRARDTKLNREVAIKILPAGLAGDPDRLARFRREAQLLASVNHPNIAQIYGFEDSGATHALVLELVEGPTLAEMIDRAGGIPRPDALAIASQIVDALEAAHALGIIHRDLKPANIKVRPDGTVKVLDFGLAKALGAESTSTAAGGLADSPTITSPAMTQLGMILGTAAYMAPEQAKGRAVDKRADIWAFGCVLGEMLTGRRTFGGDDVSDTLANILKSEPEWTALPADTPTSLRRLLRRCLSKDLSGRLSDIGVARLEIAEAIAPPPDLAEGQPGIRPAPPVSKPRFRWRDVALGAAGVALVAVSPFLFAHFRETPPAPAAIRFLVAPPAGTGFSVNQARSAAAVSPDGRVVVFRANRPGAPATLWVRVLDTVDPRELRGTEGANVPFWSPDSRSIAFMADGKLKRVDVAGGPVQIVCDAPAARSGTWSPGGTMVFANPDGGLSRVAAAGGQAVALTTLERSRQETAHRSPQFLPDGRRFLFTAQPGNVVFLGSLDSPDRTRLFEADSAVRYAPPGYLLFVREGTLMAQSFDASRAAMDGDAVPIAETVRTVIDGAPAGVFSVSDTGVLVYELAQPELGGIPVWVDRQGRELGPAGAGIGDVHFPRLSPDGRRLAVIRGGDLWVDDLQGRPSIRLTFDGKQSEHYSPLWSPDGQRLVYETVGPSSLHSLPADGSSSTPAVISPSGHLHPHGWSSGGQELIAVRVGASQDIVAFPLGEKSEMRAVVETPANEGGAGAALSPDGRWLAYAANPTERLEIWVRPYPGPGAPVRVSPNGGAEPVWARNGRELYYVEGTRRLMVVAVQPGADFRFAPPALLVEGAYMHGNQPPTYDVAPDGRLLLLKPVATEVPGAQPLTVVVNWVDELKRRIQPR